MRLLFFLQRATFPSMKSKNNPKGMNASAAHRLPCADGGPRQYRNDEKIDMTPQKPVCVHQSLTNNVHPDISRYKNSGMGKLTVELSNQIS